MGRRLKVGLFLDNSDLWTGGLYYIVNIVQALKTLPHQEQPKLYIFYRRTNELKFIEETGYPHTVFLDAAKRLTLYERVVNKFARTILGRNIIRQQFKPSIVDLMYPNAGFQKELELVQNQVWWIPDFQEKYYPAFFTAAEIDQRSTWQTKLAFSASQIVFSSNSALKDFTKFYPGYTAHLHTVRFAVSHQAKDLKAIFANCLELYKLPPKYFLVSNQFWKHKNHLTVVDALALAVARIPEMKIVFTGKESDYRDPAYPQQVKQAIADQGLNPHIAWLGFIDKEHMVSIMKYSHAVIQPSLFEGWSTVIEDAKSLDKKVLASDLEVHREQLGEKGVYFDPLDAGQLSLEMEKMWNADTTDVSYNYKAEIERFAREFYTMAASIVREKEILNLSASTEEKK